MAIKLKKLRQSMGSAKKDSATPLPRKQGDIRSAASKVKIIGGLKSLKRIYLPKAKEVSFVTNVSSASGDGSYVVKLKFTELTGEAYREAKPKKLKVETTGNTEVWIDKPNINRNPVLCSCTCDDFRFVWEYPMFKNRHLMRKDFQTSKQQLTQVARTYTSYDRVTPPVGSRPPGATNPNEKGGRDFKNPNNVLGMCKHVYRLAQFLVARDVIEGSF